MTARLVLAIAALVVTGCKRETRVIVETAPPPPPPVARTETFETDALRREIDIYDQQPSTVQAARVKKAFAKIDGEIAELVEHVATKTGEEKAEAARKLTDLRSYRDGEHVRFLALEVKARIRLPRDAAEIPATPPREGGAEKLGEKIDDAARKVKEGVKDAADAIRD